MRLLESCRHVLLSVKQGIQSFLLISVFFSCGIILVLNTSFVQADNLLEQDNIPSVLDANFTSKPDKQNKSDKSIDSAFLNININNEQSKQVPIEASNKPAEVSNKKDTQTPESKKPILPSDSKNTDLDSYDKTSSPIKSEKQNTAPEQLKAYNHGRNKKTNSVSHNPFFIKPLAEKFQTNISPKDNKSENTSPNKNILSIQPLPEEYQKKKTPVGNKKTTNTLPPRTVSDAVQNKPALEQVEANNASNVKKSQSVPINVLEPEFAKKYNEKHTSIPKTAQPDNAVGDGDKEISTQEKALWVKTLSGRYQTVPNNSQKTATDPNSNAHISPVTPDSVQLQSSKPVKSSVDTNHFIDKPTKEEIQLAIDSFRDNDNPFFERYRICSRNGVVDSPTALFEINEESMFNDSTEIEFYPVKNNIMNMIQSKDYQMPFVKELHTFTSSQFVMSSFLDADMQINVVNYMLSQDLQKWLEKLDDLSIGYAPNYNDSIDSMWFTWIWGAIAFGVLLLLMLISPIYQFISWRRSQEYNISMASPEAGIDMLIPATAELYTDVSSPCSSDIVPGQSPYGGIEIFIDKRTDYR